MSNIRILPKSKWPSILKEIPEPPNELWIRGENPPKDVTWLCVIGSRKHSMYGKQVCEKIIKELKDYKIGIVSGLAVGIDVLAHKLAMKYKLPIIAVPGSGLDPAVLYPRLHTQIAEEIISNGGCLISEFSPMQQAATWLFPKRNRIMAGMSDGILVIESTRKSGTQITARLALDYNREVMVVPGSIFSELSSGPHYLLKQGAVPVTSAEDILETFGIEVEVSKKISLENLSEIELKIFRQISRSPISKDELYIESGMPSYEINRIITVLELEDLIIEVNGVICCKV